VTMLRGSGLGIIFTLLAIGVMIALCLLLLAPHLGYHFLVERTWRRHRADERLDPALEHDESEEDTLENPVAHASKARIACDMHHSAR
jgi:hypothetical protein